MITVMEVDDCGVVEPPLKTSLNFLIKLPKPPPKTEAMMIEEPEKVIIKNNIHIESTHSIIQKKTRIWPQSMRKRMENMTEL